jgi:hypothetical protein
MSVSKLVYSPPSTMGRTPVKTVRSLSQQGTQQDPLQSRCCRRHLRNLCYMRSNIEGNFGDQDQAHANGI